MEQQQLSPAKERMEEIVHQVLVTEPTNGDLPLEYSRRMRNDIIAAICEERFNGPIRDITLKIDQHRKLLLSLGIDSETDDDLRILQGQLELLKMQRLFDLKDDPDVQRHLERHMRKASAQGQTTKLTSLPGT